MFNSINFTPRRNVFHKYGVIAMFSVLGFAMSLALPQVVGAPLAIFFVFAYVQFTYAAVKRCGPTDEPFLVRWLGNTKRTWERFSQPLMIMQHNGKTIFVRRVSHDFSEYYSADGKMIGTEQETDWSMIDMHWISSDPQDVVVRFVPKNKLKQPDRLSWLALSRSKDTASAKPVFTENLLSQCLNNARVGCITDITTDETVHHIRLNAA